jgi:hypothetical protein
VSSAQAKATVVNKNTSRIMLFLFMLMSFKILPPQKNLAKGLRKNKLAYLFLLKATFPLLPGLYCLDLSSVVMI